MGSYMLDRLGYVLFFNVEYLLRWLRMAEALEPLQRGHARSVSAGGMAMVTSPATTRPSALRKGHQRAFSHGQVIHPHFN
jgi:hypothetical protein